MSSLVFLLSKKLKNTIREAFHRPAQLIVIIVFVALLGFTVFSGNHASRPLQSLRSIEELYAIVLALYAFVFVLGAKNGFVNGASMFSMADVNLLFVSPRKSETLLTFGLIGQLARSLMLGFFILYQYSWVHDAYGVGLGFLVAVIIGYGVTVFLSQMFAMLIYSFTCGSDKKNKLCKGVFFAVIAAFVLYVVYGTYMGKGELLDNAVSAANAFALKFFPVAGFVQLGVVSAVTGRYAQLGISLLCFAGCCILYFVLISVLNCDYYEDVLKATEVSFSAITARKEGKAAENAPRNVKVGKTGLNKGFGASAIAYKHKVENRRSKLLVLDTVSLIMSVATIVMAIIIHDAVAAFVFNTYVMIFTVGTGRWAKELTLPYIYMIPEPPFKKLINMLKEQFPSLIAESAVCFIPLYFILKLSVIDTVGFFAAKISFAFLFIGVNLILQRIFGNGGKKVLIIFVYFFMAMLFSIPAIVAYAIMSITVVNIGLSFLAMAAVNTITALAILFCCRNILSCAQYN